MKYENLIVERRGNIAIVILNRPENLNALNLDLMKDIEKVTEEFQDDLETRVVIFTGAGKHFSAGADLGDPKRVAKAKATMLAKQRSAHLGPRMLRKLFEMNQITIAAINGAALGGGACIVSALDFRIGAQDCTVGYPEAKLGISLSWVGLPLCVHLIGPARAKRMVILAQKEKARTLLDWGFLDEVVKNERLMERALEMAEEYASQPPIAAQMIKRSVNSISSALDQAIMHMDTDQVLLTNSTEDHAEGIQAFFQKRKPNFKGN
ncbi:MAG: enoyl-CoA hydratase/isomerase family protein [Deltaproteobacteria bacterium]|nr:enoyl-CoA hydratase/isomerase family protein [Deltaproteobacteria bacterium]MBW2053146.1 enoyl-CoA hydratase/isomerase family protein [Deltaproteobacteria bacterium]MBW2324449.1 enoyl-CoA hydratase/isomerase family protein [Deltaproteobacteria bacterium]